MNTFRFLGLFVVFCAAFLPSFIDAYGLARIVGGTETTIQKRPYQASLQYTTGLPGATHSHSCGASIISTKFLLSAAHCQPNILTYYYARVGSTAYNNGGVLKKVSAFTAHPNYRRDILDYDFAIVELETELVLGANIAIIPLTSGSNPADGSMVTVSGWGVTSEASSTAVINLREVNLPVVNVDKCRGVYSFITPRQICLGGTPQGGTSACFGDSGGPAVQNGVQYGLVSGGNSCTLPNIPGIFARISSARDWITSLTGV